MWWEREREKEREKIEKKRKRRTNKKTAKPPRRAQKFFWPSHITSQSRHMNPSFRSPSLPHFMHVQDDFFFFFIQPSNCSWSICLVLPLHNEWISKVPPWRSPWCFVSEQVWQWLIVALLYNKNVPIMQNVYEYSCHLPPSVNLHWSIYLGKSEEAAICWYISDLFKGRWSLLREACVRCWCNTWSYKVLGSFCTIRPRNLGFRFC